MNPELERVEVQDSCVERHPFLGQLHFNFFGGLGNDGYLPDVTSSLGIGAGLVVGKGRGWPDTLFA